MTKTGIAAALLSTILSTAAVAQAPSDVATLKRKVADLEERVLFLQRRVLDLSSNETIWINPTSPDKYQRLDGTLGFFLVSLNRVEPYLDGQRVFLDIGNPSSISFDGFTLSAEWGKRVPDDTKQWEQWNAGLRQKELSFTDTLLPGMWTRVDFVLAPAPTTEFGHLALSIQTDTVSLRRSTR